ncbi:MAG: hypothetical protein ABJC89_10550 [Acidobacteriota bacterium]
MSPARAILSGTLVVGTLDALDAIVFFGLRSGAHPMRIFQSIASGVLGPASFEGGVRSAALGVFLHYVIAFGIVLVFFIASRRITFLTRHAVVSGILYGVAAYFVMNRVVIPLSAIGAAQSVAWPVFVNGILIHAFGVGLPAAFFARAASPR